MKNGNHKINIKEGVLTLDGIDVILEADKNCINKQIDTAIKAFRCSESVKELDGNPLRDMLSHVIIASKIGETDAKIDAEDVKKKLDNILAGSLYNAIVKTNHIQHTITHFFAANPDILKHLQTEEYKYIVITQKLCKSLNKKLNGQENSCKI